MLQRGITLILAILLYSLSVNSFAQSNSFVELNSWLCGKWEGSDKSIHAKYMIKAQDNFLKGIALRENPDGSKNALEAIRIFKHGSKWILMILGAETNEKKYYELRDFSTRFMLFERSDKSFPKKVSFYRLDDNLIRIAMEGFTAGKRLRKMDFYLYKSRDFNPEFYQVDNVNLEAESVKL